MAMPDGYRLLRKHADYIIVGALFSELNKLAPAVIVLDSVVYERGILEPIPLELASDFCSLRRYDRYDFMKR